MWRHWTGQVVGSLPRRWQSPVYLPVSARFATPPPTCGAPPPYRRFSPPLRKQRETLPARPNAASTGTTLYMSIFVQNRRTLYYLNRSRENNLQFDSENSIQLKILFVQPCTYCSRAPGTDSVIGLDRVHSQLVYTIDNVVSCCFPCNLIKWTSTVNDFFGNVSNDCQSAAGHGTQSCIFGVQDVKWTNRAHYIQGQ
jgi:hypothetical protein